MSTDDVKEVCNNSGGQSVKPLVQAGPEQRVVYDSVYLDTSRSCLPITHSQPNKQLNKLSALPMASATG